MRIAFVLTLACAAALSACSKPQEEMGLVNWQKAPPLVAGLDEGALPPQAGGPLNPAADIAAARAGATNAPAAASAGTPAAATTTSPAATGGASPIRKAGLWQTTTDQGRGPQTSTLCVTADSEARRGVFGGGGGRNPGCAPKIAKAGAGWTATVSCTREFGEQSMKVSSTETLTGDLSANYKITGKSTTTGGREGSDGTRNITASGVYKGACPAGQKGGDIVNAAGEKRNIFDAPQGRGPGGGGPQG